MFLFFDFLNKKRFLTIAMGVVVGSDFFNFLNQFLN